MGMHSRIPFWTALALVALLLSILTVAGYYFGPPVHLTEGRTSCN